ncbi:PREDICTED: steroid 17-alpha-hydroxylase/17,20 lyase-like, partial [Rhagoletis zephyria]|uniref:steroid 17-alpha-hydroxylase/17,20 lyase-like n=1 Tax=Rhagoletis zephyria TaxID=28612 RepID=UPI0008116836
MTLTWALYYLCRHETVRQKLQEEVDEFLKNKESSSEMTEVLTNKSALKYLEAVLKETMRLAPAGPYLGRKAAVDVILPVSSANSEEKEFITIPAGTNVIVMSQYMHYSERYFREAGSFIPERWLEVEGEICLPPPCYNPFSAGTRACIGE